MTEPSNIYILPSISIHSNFADAGAAIELGGARRRQRLDEQLDLASLAKGKRTLIVGEPGVGKSAMLEKLAERLTDDSVSVDRIPLRSLDALERIEACAHAVDNARRAVLLDGFDEVPLRFLPEILRRIIELSLANADLSIFLSSRWVFAKRYAAHFAQFRIVTLHPFTIGQVRQYLDQAGHDKNSIDTLLQRVQFGHRTLILQIPRYLYYLASFVSERGIDAAAKISRNELFEYFIYRKLDLEDRKLHAEKKALVKRLLEKLALVMEIYQANVITTDELMTFFDDLKSDLKLITLAQVALEVFYDCSLLRVSQDAIDKVEFENSEFQEYLAAKEISRLADPNRIAFGFSVDVDANEIRPSWYNTLTFLVDLQPSLLQPLTEYSGLLRNDPKVVEESFFSFVSRMDPNAIPFTDRATLFLHLIDYHARALQWLSVRLTGTLSVLFGASLEVQLKNRVSDAESKTGARRYVPLANIVEVVGALLRDKRPLDILFWREKLLKYATDDSGHTVLQRQALSSLSDLGDSSVIPQLQAIRSPDQLVTQVLIDTCIDLDPDDEGTLEVVFTGVRRNNIHARRGLYSLRSAHSVCTLLTLIADDDEFRAGFIEGMSVFRDKDSAIASVVAAVQNEEVREKAKSALIAMLQHEFTHRVEHSLFLPALWRVLSTGDTHFVADMIHRLKTSRGGSMSLFYARHLFAEAIDEHDVGAFISAMRAADDERGAIEVMNLVKHSARQDAEVVYETGRRFASDAYQRLEVTQATGESLASQRRREEMLREFRLRLEPEPGKFREDVFSYYNCHAGDLDPQIGDLDRARLRELITGTVFKFENPGKHIVQITEEANGSKSFTINSAVGLYEEAAKTALHLNVDASIYRAAILSLIPFAYDDELRTIFGLVPQIRSGELDHVLLVYTRRDSDLWRHRPASLVEAVKKYHAVDAVPVLRAFVLEGAIEGSAREQALQVADSLVPSAEYLRDVFARYCNGNNTERRLAQSANASLITSHIDSDAVRWRLAQLELRAAPIVKRKRMSALSALEGEISFTKEFAQPLMLLAQRGYEVEFLRLLENATLLWGRGTDFQPYAEYLWDIVYAYFDNLKEFRSYEPLRMVEATILNLADREGANWLSHKMTSLRRSYLAHIGRPRSIGEAVEKYNKAKQYTLGAIRDSSDLFHQLKDAIEVDLRRWIEGEGAYSVLMLESRTPKRKHLHEDLIQRTLKTQIESILLKRGFQVDVVREPQLLDHKRVDFLVRYGFAGPVVVEIKLTSNTDLRVRNLTGTRSYHSMRRYIEGYGAPHGIFLVVNNTKARNLEAISHAYEKIENVHVQTLDCAVDSYGQKVQQTRAKTRNSRYSVALTGSRSGSKRKR